MTQKLDNSRISKHLGQSSQYTDQYDPSLLVREPRASNRHHLDIDDDALPFQGTDTWNAYEISALRDDGVPVVGIGKIAYSAASKYIVESKSLKLYLNSFNGTKLGSNTSEVLSEMEYVVSRDLSKLLEVEVYVRILSNKSALHLSQFGSVVDEWHLEMPVEKHITDVNQYITIEDGYLEDVDWSPRQEFSVYQEDPDLLKVIDNPVSGVVRYHSALLKSNCRVTSQPDWGDVYITIKGNKTVDPLSLLEYIVSFRNECHFHEEICETIYKRLYDLLKPEGLSVRCLYARRGGIDINPERYNDIKYSHYALSDVNMAHIKTPKQ